MTWQEGYEAVAQVPLASQAFVDFNDNAFLSMGFGQQSAGDYVWELSDEREVVGVWKYPEETAGITSYFNGSSVSGDYKSRIKYVSDGFYSALTSGSSTDPVQIAAARGLDYNLETSTNLLDAWESADPVWETGTSALDPYFEAVTNEIPATEEKKFVTLEVVEE